MTVVMMMLLWCWVVNCCVNHCCRSYITTSWLSHRRYIVDLNVCTPMATTTSPDDATPDVDNVTDGVSAAVTAAPEEAAIANNNILFMMMKLCVCR